jgi:hypothetical protein
VFKESRALSRLQYRDKETVYLQQYHVRQNKQKQKRNTLQIIMATKERQIDGSRDGNSVFQGSLGAAFALLFNARCAWSNRFSLAVAHLRRLFPQ